MRRIKFRVYDTVQEVMRKVIKVDLKNGIIVADGGYLTVTDTFDIFETFDLEQYIGIKDKNEKEIYEGDKIKYVVYNNFLCEDETKIGIVKFEYGAFKVDGELFDRFKEIEIIGNIHED